MGMVMEVQKGKLPSGLMYGMNCALDMLAACWSSTKVLALLRMQAYLVVFWLQLYDAVEQR